MKVIIKLEDPTMGSVTKEYIFDGLKRRFAICRAINFIRDDNSVRMLRVTDIKTKM